VYQGPQGYVSPTLYATTSAAPTWNFTAVHLRGRLEPIEGRAATLDVVRRTAAALEHELGDGWDQSESLGYFDTLLPGVGAFSLTVDTADGMFKLSQEQQPAVRDRVACSFARSDRGGHRQLAELMVRAMPAEDDDDDR
jgi:transcriptional regulator